MHLAAIFIGMASRWGDPKQSTKNGDTIAINLKLLSDISPSTFPGRWQQDACPKFGNLKVSKNRVSEYTENFSTNSNAVIYNSQRSECILRQST